MTLFEESNPFSLPPADLWKSVIGNHQDPRSLDSDVPQNLSHGETSGVEHQQGFQLGRYKISESMTGHGMKFTKMQGAGNDYIYIDCFTERVPDDLPALARAVSNRNTGIGGDGLILICPSEQADAQMRMFNADGSESEMCGNGIRCVAKYVYDHGIVHNDELKILTGNGILTLQVFSKNGVAEQVRVNMGRPIMEADSIPTTLPGNPPVGVPLEVGRHNLQVTCVSMGNPHCITFVDEITDGLGPRSRSSDRSASGVSESYQRGVHPDHLADGNEHACLGTGQWRNPSLRDRRLCRRPLLPH